MHVLSQSLAYLRHLNHLIRVASSHPQPPQHNGRQMDLHRITLAQEIVLLNGIITVVATV